MLEIQQVYDIFETVLKKTENKLRSNDYLELRYHNKTTMSLLMKNNILEESYFDEYCGVGIRVLCSGAWGFIPTSIIEKTHILNTIYKAKKIADYLSTKLKEKVYLAPIKPIRGRFSAPIKIDPHSIPLEEKIEILSECNKIMKDNDAEIKSCTSFYNEPHDLKVIQTSEGTCVEIKESKPDFFTSVYAKSSTGEMINHTESIGTLGGFEFIKEMNDPYKMAEKTNKIAREILNAPRAPSGSQIVIMDPTMVGIITHEAIGHLAEADYVLSGSALKDKMGKIITNELISIVDSGKELGSGWLPIDDEGVETKEVTIINEGMLENYLHTRSTAAHFKTEPSGNARAWEYDDPPLTRMRNTYVKTSHKVNWKRNEIIEDTRNGVLLAGDGEGSADSTSEFMFTALNPYLIKNGEISTILKPCTISGVAFDVLKLVDAIANDNWMLKMGNGSCGKIQPIKVDGGGPTIRISNILIST
ncbi:MAG: hypothetical protein HeimC3_38960 [Candidatus Heimdallarchaeota archaeon LC_3]|nr:MAG: hypothetical protein HeimC3_38960 [Candidatus Heimdallarchaeota archaeon LC_3]